MSRKATMAKLADLHRQFAEVLTEAIQPQPDENGVLQPPSAAVMAQVNAFLKNNGITADAEDDPALAALKRAAAQKLPFPTQVDEDGHPVAH